MRTDKPWSYHWEESFLLATTDYEETPKNYGRTEFSFPLLESRKMNFLKSSSAVTLTILAIIFGVATFAQGAEEPSASASENTSEKVKSSADEDDDDDDDAEAADEDMRDLKIEKYAHPCNKCDYSLFKTHMEDFNTHVANQSLASAREILDNVTDFLESMPERERSKEVQKICFGAALMCDQGKQICECMKIEVDGRKFHFIAEHDHHKGKKICRADVGTFCQPGGFKCRANHICLDNVCTLAESGCNNLCVSQVAIMLVTNIPVMKILAQFRW